MRTALFQESLGSETTRINTGGIHTLIALCRDNASHVFRHGDAVTLAKLLQRNGIKAGTAKFYAEKTATIVKAAQRVACRAIIELPKNERTTASQRAMAEFFDSLETKDSIAAIMEEIKPLAQK